MIREQLERLETVLANGDPAQQPIKYILNRLWPDLEAAMHMELPQGVTRPRSQSVNKKD
jgi:hypothetical protein